MTWLDEELIRQKVSAHKVAKAAGLCDPAISTWRRGSSPSIGNFDAVLNVLGYRLAVAPL